ncbi:hypothetical protein YC2023_022193 [Brassica napus]
MIPWETSLQKKKKKQESYTQQLFVTLLQWDQSWWWNVCLTLEHRNFSPHVNVKAMEKATRSNKLIELERQSKLFLCL